MSKQIELICSALEIIRQGFINIQNARSDHNIAVIEDLNVLILDIEELEKEGDQ